MILVWNLLKDLWEDLCIRFRQSLVVFPFEFELTLIKINLANVDVNSREVNIVFPGVCSL